MFNLENVIYKDVLNIPALHIPKDKITCIVGGSGSGKTTLLRLLNKLISNDNGEIKFNNIPLSEINSITHRRKVAMLSQSPAIFKGNIRDNLNIGLKFSEKDLPSDDVLEDILNLVQLNKTLDDNSEVLSGGEKQRLALARVLLLEPEVLLLDEPSSALDEETEKLIIEKLVHYAKNNDSTLIMVTHSRSVAENYSNYIIEISNGNVISQGEVASWIK
ncbi:ABC transporter ATP-binding protein [Oceanirhabdus seepicola]|uniref:ATP-binding cassette domain-containing protein n=1 Tax=Oceanirhabdus seepicola TaxID=2828781 RepID=A0A9J6P0P3_9CLOT|nr:ATP-binding cassette domain-containing protein [Oceanirhabdus seepicola]MCM1989766.1 ATP-binding cassette domain-containing protein [Oceanirhabdus seepicola]